jgi:uncharacterized protein YkwD
VLSAFGYEQRPEYEYGPSYDSRPDYDLRAPDYDLRPWSDRDPEPEEEPEPRPKKTTRMLVVAGSVIALLLVGAVAFAGTVLLGGNPTKTNATAGGAGGGEQLADPATVTSADASVEPTPSDVAESTPSPEVVDSPSPTPPKASPTKTKASPTRAAPQENTSQENAVLQIVNAERAKAGCKALTIDSRLTAAARKHSADMAARNYFSHDSLEGVSFSQRIDREGYRWSTVGENIAAGQDSPTSVMKAWMNSPGHRANILNCSFRNIGIGLKLGGKFRFYWTQDFGTLR